jgi:putative oxidoreductase
MITISIIGQAIFGLYFVSGGLNHLMNTKTMSAYAASKKVPSPGVAVMGTGLLLILGGLGVAFNMNLQIACILLLIFLIPTTFIMHAFWNDHDATMKMMNTVNFSKNIALIGAVLMLLR